MSVESVAQSLLAAGVLEQGPRLRDEDFAQAERLLGRVLPASVRALYEVIGNGSGVILPLITGEETSVRRGDAADAAEWFSRLTEARGSAVGFAVSQAEALEEGSEEYPEPEGLLYVGDFGCNIYFGVDLLHPQLRVIEIEGADDVEDPFAEARERGVQLAYTLEQVPRGKLAWFTLAAQSLESWLSRYHRGADFLRAEHAAH